MSTRTTSVRPVTAVLAALFTVTVTAAGLSAADPTYELHEWGVFSVPRGTALTNADLQAEWSSFPAWFIKRMKPQQEEAPMPVRKPVMFFKASADMDVDVQVRLPGGKPIVWYPEVHREGSDSLLWQVRLMAGKASGLEHHVPENHWIQPLRDANADGVHTREAFPFPIPFNSEGNNISLQKSSLQNPNITPAPVAQGERFLYYDGLIPRFPSPTVSTVNGQWLIALPAGDVCHDVVAAWRRGGTLHVATAAGAHAASSTVALQPVAAKDISAMWTVLVDGSVAAGLDPAAAKALRECWKESLCNEGMTVLWRIPAAAYDRVLPLSATPAATKQVRVGLVQFTRCEPTLEADLLALFTELAKEKPADLDGTLKVIEAYGSAVVPMLRTIAETKRLPTSGDLSWTPAVHRRLIETLERLDPAAKPSATMR